MSENDHLMATADAVASQALAAKIIEDAGMVWNAYVGPPSAYVEWENGPVIDQGPFQYRARTRAVYVAVAYGAAALDYGNHRALGTSDLSKFRDWFPEALRQVATLCAIPTVEESRDRILTKPKITPETHDLLWRELPEIQWDEILEAWMFYARFTFVPKGVTIIPLGDQ